MIVLRTGVVCLEAQVLSATGGPLPKARALSGGGFSVVYEPSRLLAFVFVGMGRSRLVRADWAVLKNGAVLCRAFCGLYTHRAFYTAKRGKLDVGGQRGDKTNLQRFQSKSQTTRRTFRERGKKKGGWGKDMRQRSGGAWLGH